MSDCKNCKFGKKINIGLTTYYLCDSFSIPHENKKNCSAWKGKNKYNNVKTKKDGIVFDSKKEAAKYSELLMLEKAGQIANLKRQVKFEIVPKNGDERAAYYVADFVYELPSGQKVCEDTKSAITKQNPVYILKRKLFKNIYKDYKFIES